MHFYHSYPSSHIYHPHLSSHVHYLCQLTYSGPLFTSIIYTGLPTYVSLLTHIHHCPHQLTYLHLLSSILAYLFISIIVYISLPYSHLLSSTLAYLLMFIIVHISLPIYIYHHLHQLIY